MITTIIGLAPFMLALYVAIDLYIADNYNKTTPLLKLIIFLIHLKPKKPEGEKP